MKKISLCLVCFALVFALVVESSSNSSYDLMADVNRDRVVDVNDLSTVGKAYGSNLMLPSEPGKTVVTVLSFDREPPEAENARVAIIDPEVCGDAVNVTYTNSSGIATFDLSPNKNYTAIAWGGSAYNYANFTTNSLSEASTLMLLGEPSMPRIRALPKFWVPVTLLNNQTGSLFSDMVKIIFFDLKLSLAGEWSGTEIGELYTEAGIYVPSPDWTTSKPHSKIGVCVITMFGNVGGSGVYSPDDDGCANVIVYVTPP